MLPKLKYQNKTRRKQTVSFAGLNLTDMLSEGELTECVGLTGERAPFLSPRYADRHVCSLGKPNGLFAADGILYIAAGSELFAFDGDSVRSVASGLSDEKKQFAYIGGALCIFPDKKLFSPESGELCDMEASVTVSGFDIAENTVTRTDGGSFPFSVNDAVTISGYPLYNENCVTAVITAIDGSTLCFGGNSFRPQTGTSSITLKRAVPDLDFICEHDNRLWGVRDNRIYASWLGMPCNFFAYDTAHSQASFYADVGTEGEFTAAVSCPSYIVFAKGDKLHKLYGSKPSNYRLSLSRVSGVAEGSGDSAVISNDCVVYNSEDGVYAYGGGEPEYLSFRLGRLGSDACAACSQGTYYIAVTRDGVRTLFSYDLRRGLWFCDGEKDAVAMTSFKGSVWYLSSKGELFELGGASEVGEWSATLAPFTEDASLRRYSRIFLKVWLAKGASLRLSADNGAGKKSIYIRHADEDMRYELPLPLHSGSSLSVSLSGKGKCLVKGIIREFYDEG